eukprot:GHVQ01004853.1.p1 GENE.GHVQ01004853.1~~GHVQ01004853.1.p1  ORF type:complete len:858 (+),score=114.43 GHVQ01004853.1:1535-4108(+)
MPPCMSVELRSLSRLQLTITHSRFSLAALSFVRSSMHCLLRWQVLSVVLHVLELWGIRSDPSLERMCVTLLSNRLYVLAERWEMLKSQHELQLQRIKQLHNISVTRPTDADQLPVVGSSVSMSPTPSSLSPHVLTNVLQSSTCHLRPLPPPDYLYEIFLTLHCFVTRLFLDRLRDESYTLKRAAPPIDLLYGSNAARERPTHPGVGRGDTTGHHSSGLCASEPIKSAIGYSGPWVYRIWYSFYELRQSATHIASSAILKHEQWNVRFTGGTTEDTPNSSQLGDSIDRIEDQKESSLTHTTSRTKWRLDGDSAWPDLWPYAHIPSVAVDLGIFRAITSACAVPPSCDIPPPSTVALDLMFLPKFDPQCGGIRPVLPAIPLSFAGCRFVHGTDYTSAQTEQHYIKPTPPPPSSALTVSAPDCPSPNLPSATLSSSPNIAKTEKQVSGERVETGGDSDQSGEESVVGMEDIVPTVGCVAHFDMCSAIGDVVPEVWPLHGFMRMATQDNNLHNDIGDASRQLESGAAFQLPHSSTAAEDRCTSDEDLYNDLWAFIGGRVRGDPSWSLLHQPRSTWPRLSGWLVHASAAVAVLQLATLEWYLRRPPVEMARMVGYGKTSDHGRLPGANPFSDSMATAVDETMRGEDPCVAFVESDVSRKRKTRDGEIGDISVADIMRIMKPDLVELVGHIGTDDTTTRGWQRGADYAWNRVSTLRLLRCVYGYKRVDVRMDLSTGSLVLQAPWIPRELRRCMEDGASEGVRSLLTIMFAIRMICQATEHTHRGRTCTANRSELLQVGAVEVCGLFGGGPLCRDACRRVEAYSETYLNTKIRKPFKGRNIDSNFGEKGSHKQPKLEADESLRG